MGLPALKYDADAAPARPSHPRRSDPAPARVQGRRPRCDADASARSMFRVFALVLLAIALLGLGRVWMTVRAAESSLHSEELREQIENARYEGDMLEIRRSALASPSRVLAVASATMDMVPAVKVTYLDVTPSPSVTTASRDVHPRTDEPDAVGELVEHVLGMAAGEAQVLLVGDVSLASAR